MYDYHVIVGVVAVVIGFIGYVPYFSGIFRGSVKPHVFTWLGWGLVTGVVFVAQLVEGGGAGAYATGITCLCVTTIGVLALFKGEKDITPVDWIFFIGGLLGIVLWIVTDNPLTAVAIETIVDALVFAPTWRKAFLKPWEESATSFTIGVVKFSLGLLVLESFNPTTALYPMAIVVMDSSFVVMLLIRRRQLAKR